MKRFKEFAQEKILDGEKEKIDNILNKEIIIRDYRIRNSRYSKNRTGEYLTLQIEHEDKISIVFTGSDVLIDQVKKYQSEMPFLVTIRKINRYYSLT